MTKRTLVKDLKVPEIGDPVLSGFSELEEKLFLQVMGASIQAMHQSQPLNLSRNMELYFRDALKSSIFLAGMAVDEYRGLQDELQNG